MRLHTSTGADRSPNSASRGVACRISRALVAWITGAKYRHITGSRYDVTPPGPSNARHGTPTRHAYTPGKHQISNGSETPSPGCAASTHSKYLLRMVRCDEC